MSLLLVLNAGGAASYTLDTTPGAYTLTGSSSYVFKDSLLSSTTGSYALTGSQGILSKDSVLNASSGAYTLTGFSADLSYTPVAGSFILDTVVGEYSLTGFDATIEYTPVQQVSGGTNIHHLRDRIRRDDEEVLKVVKELFLKMVA